MDRDQETLVRALKYEPANRDKLTEAVNYFARTQNNIILPEECRTELRSMLGEDKENRKLAELYALQHGLITPADKDIPRGIIWGKNRYDPESGMPVIVWDEQLWQWVPVNDWGVYMSRQPIRGKYGGQFYHALDAERSEVYAKERNKRLPTADELQEALRVRNPSTNQGNVSAYGIHFGPVLWYERCISPCKAIKPGNDLECTVDTIGMRSTTLGRNKHLPFRLCIGVEE